MIGHPSTSLVKTSSGFLPSSSFAGKTVFSVSPLAALQKVRGEGVFPIGLRQINTEQT
jgi:hypothetical protein